MNYSRHKFRHNVLTDISENFDKLMTVFDNLPEVASDLSSGWMLKMDVKEEPTQFIVYAEVPGIDPKDIDISFDNGCLTIKGQKSLEKKDEKENFLRIERSSGSFMRQIALPESIDSNRVKAKTKNGVLEITLPKKQQSTSRKIQVEDESDSS